MLAHSRDTVRAGHAGKARGNCARPGRDAWKGKTHRTRDALQSLGSERVAGGSQAQRAKSGARIGRHNWVGQGVGLNERTDDAGQVGAGLQGRFYHRFMKTGCNWTT